jgi:hypothetical protein
VSRQPAKQKFLGNSLNQLCIYPYTISTQKSFTLLVMKKYPLSIAVGDVFEDPGDEIFMDGAGTDDIFYMFLFYLFMFIIFL